MLDLGNSSESPVATRDDDTEVKAHRPYIVRSLSRHGRSSGHANWISTTTTGVRSDFQRPTADFPIFAGDRLLARFLQHYGEILSFEENQIILKKFPRNTLQRISLLAFRNAFPMFLPAEPCDKNELTTFGPKKTTATGLHCSNVGAVTLAHSVFENFDEDNRVLVLEYISSSPHFETSVEIALRLAERNSDVTYCHMGSALPFVDFRRNIFGLSIPTLRMLDFRPQSGRRLDRVEALAKTEVPSEASRIIWNFPKSGKRESGEMEIPSQYLESLDKLATFSFDGLAIGIGLANSLSAYLDRITAIPARHRGLLEKILDSQMRVISFLNQLLQTENFTDVVVFNGRFAVPQAAGEVAKKFGLKLWRHEMGANDLAGFQLLPFATHDQAKVGKAALERWQQPDISVTEKTKVVRQSTNYSNPLRRQEATEIEFSFSKERRKSTREENVGLQRDIITFFTSTEGEFELLGPLTPKSVFKSQRDAALALKEITKEAHANLVIRVHPNVANHSRDETNWWKEFAKQNAGENCVVYGPKSKVDSYRLLRQARLVMVWYSTIGLEAIGESIPCLSLSDNPYLSTGAEIHLAKSLHDIRQSVAQPPKVHNPNSVLPWFYFLEVSQEKFRWFHPTGRHSGTLFGKRFR